MAASHWIWQRYPGINFDECHKSNLVRIDDFTFIFATKAGFYSFNTKQNKWEKKKKKLSKYSTSLSIAYNANSKDLFISTSRTNSSTHFHIFNMGRKELQRITSDETCLPQLICMDSVCHCIGPDGDVNGHKVFNHDTKRWEYIHIFDEPLSNFGSFELEFSSKRKELLLFGGYQLGADWNKFNEIHKYALSTNKWTKLDIKLPTKMARFGHVITKEQQYVIILGGHKHFDLVEGREDLIYIFNLESMEIVQSEIRLPGRMDCDAVIMENKEENDLLVHGFIRKEINKFNMNIPFALISLIGIWHSIEYIHVISKRGRKHWKINIDRLFE